MKRQRLTSQVLESVGYKPETRTLEVEFKENGVYRYFGVPEKIYREMMAAPSRGAYFNKNIKPNYRFAKMREPAT